jgi:8-oxo-dGTP pyrophosphatase MutT (NUDIX family)
VWPRARFGTVEQALIGACPDASEPHSGEGRRAAVAVVLREIDSDLEVLLIQRAIREGDPWSGHIALPGGHRDATDASLLVTAIRETREEVGLDLEQNASLLGRLASLRPVSGLALDVSPFCFALEQPSELSYGPEVVSSFWTPLGALARGEHDATYRFERQGNELIFPAWNVEGRVIWGMTYRLLLDLLGRIAARRSTPA